MMDAPYTASNVAKYIVTKCVKDDSPISNLQLQKILYYIQKTFLMKNRRAFDDAIEAWKFGPVVPGVYYYFCGFGAMPITNTYDFDAIDKDDQKIIDEIVEEKRVLSPWDLVGDTHRPGGAWDQTPQKGIIDTKLIQTVG